MGYTTEFDGEFTLSPRLAPEHKEYLRKFNRTRRMARDERIAAGMSDPFRVAVGLPIGPDGAYFVGGPGFAGQEHDASVARYNDPPSGQPGLWCNWEPNEDGSAIRWNGAEKFYDYVEWLEYLIAHFLKPWGYEVNGEVSWSGEENGDLGKIRVVNSAVRVLRGVVRYEEDAVSQ